MTHESRILVVDDEPAVAKTLSLGLRAHGYEVDVARDGARALLLAAVNHPDLVLLDLGLPDIDGIDVLRRIRGTSTVPVVILSVRDSESQKIQALDEGADDYVTKPFAMGELLARLRASLRRHSPAPENPHIETTHFRLDLTDRRATIRHPGLGGVAGEAHLTPTEWTIVEHLVRSSGRLVHQRELLADVWGETGPVDTSHLRVHLGHVRAKLEPVPSRPRYFLTEPGMGYRFVADPSIL